MNLTSFAAHRFARAIARRSFVLVGLMAAGLAVTPAFAQTTAPAQPAAPAQAAPAQPVPASKIPLNIAILDSGAVANTSVAGKSLNDQVNAELNKIEASFRKKEQTLQQQMQQLIAQRSANPPLAPAEFEAKRTALIQQDQTLQKTYEKDKQALSARVDKARTKLGETMRKILNDVTKAKNLTLVLERSAAHAFAPQWDITQDVLARLNKAMPSIKL